MKMSTAMTHPTHASESFRTDFDLFRSRRSPRASPRHRHAEHDKSFRRFRVRDSEWVREKAEGRRNIILSQILVFRNNECKSNKMEFICGWKREAEEDRRDGGAFYDKVPLACVWVVYLDEKRQRDGNSGKFCCCHGDARTSRGGAGRGVKSLPLGRWKRTETDFSKSSVMARKSKVNDEMNAKTRRKHPNPRLRQWQFFSFTRPEGILEPCGMEGKFTLITVRPFFWVFHVKFSSLLVLSVHEAKSKKVFHDG